ncbi:MAG TPA: peptidoglycan editing factor PgeF [Rhodanobacteraceae bacterium]|nr:peptidoglycan editing factor PgeF [Rhodanobacteraceae bacterium]
MGPPDAWIIPDWPAPPNVRAVTTTREGPESSLPSPFGFNLGTRCGDDPGTVNMNRAFLRDVLSLPSEPRWLRQVHGTVVARFSPLPLAGEGSPREARTGEGNSSSEIPDEPVADAAVTHTPGVVLAIQTADCLPVLFCAGDGSEIAAAHAGWRGLSAGVLEATLAATQTPRKKMIAWLGPAIAAKSYEVGGEVRDAFMAHDVAAASAFTATRPGHWSCDLYELARQRLHAAGIERIFGGDLDTFTCPCLHSYRRGGARSGRMASLVWLLA